MFIDTCNFLPWVCPLVVPQGSSPLEVDLPVACIQELSPQLLCLSFSSPLPNFPRVIQQGSSSLEEVCTPLLSWKASWLSLEVVFSRSTWHWPWGLSFTSKHFTSTSAFHFCSWVMRQFKAKRFSGQCGKPWWYLMLLAHGLTGWTVIREKRGFSGRQLLQASYLELFGLSSTPCIGEGLSFHRSHASW